MDAVGTRSAAVGSAVVLAATAAFAVETVVAH